MKYAGKRVYNALLAMSLCMVPAMQTQALVIPQSPLFTQSNVDPNIIAVIDDSGSMDFEVLLPTNDGALWWNTGDEAYGNAGSLYGNFGGGSDATWKKFVYLFPNGTGTGNRIYGDGSNDHYAIPPFIQYAYTRSSDYNKAYYDPDVTYEPWVSNGTTSFGNITSTAAPSDPVSGTSSTLNLTVDRESSSDNHKFRVYDGMVIPDGSRYYDSSWHTAASDIAVTGTASIGVGYFPATYYVKVTSGTYKLNPGAGTTYDCSTTPDPANFAAFRDNPGDFTPITGDVDALAYDGACLTKVEVKSANAPFTNNGDRTDCATPASCTYAEEIQNFANWYGYYRKRHMALRAGMGQAFEEMSSIRVGIVEINHRSDVTMLDFDTDMDTFYDDLYAIDGNSGGTPNRHALAYAGAQYMRTDSNGPIIEECQKNFAIQFTDGFSTLDYSGVGNADQNEGVPYADSYSNTLADVAMYYYNTTLRTGAGFPAGEVPVSPQCVNAPDPTSLDCNTNLHMNTYTVGLGATGQDVFGITHDEVADAYTTDPAWPDVTGARDKTQIDDLYHAAVNGRGEMYNAETTTELSTKLAAALEDIQAQLGSGASVTFNTSTLETTSRVYLAIFNSANWTGDLVSFQVNPFTGVIDAGTLLSSADQLDGQHYNSREIVTYNSSTHEGVPFRDGDIDAATTADLNAASWGTAAQVLNFLRGDDTNEGPGKYRERESVLGDIIHSDPVYVGAPRLFWPDEDPDGDFPTDLGDRYSDFKVAQQNRDGVVYVGANDGMLHAFDGETGNEVFAYVPGGVISTSTNAGLHYLANPSYTHHYYVDLAPAVSDAYIKTTTAGSVAWHTVLVGGLRAGGNALFALDITDPNALTESNAADIVMWEFTDAQLGATYSKPTVAMMENGKWAVVFGNGYNSSGTGEAYLYILYLEGGLDGTWTINTDYVRLQAGTRVGTDPNGLATPALADVDGNGKVDRIYAGDLEGNMWVFDVSDDDDTNWEVAFEHAGVPKPLFTAIYGTAPGVRQPITSKPSLVFHPDPPGGNPEPNLLVFFGTGQYLENGDISNTDTQTFYGVWDEGVGELERDDLVPQTFIANTETDSFGNSLRFITDTVVDYAGSDHGWYIDLSISGERVVVNPKIRGDIVYFNTWIPDSDACSYGGYGYLMSVDQLNGGPPDSVIFDITGDNILGSGDLRDVDGNADQVAVGREFTRGLPASSSFLGNRRYTPGTSGVDASTIIFGDTVEDLGGPKTGRLSWQELGRE